LSSYHYLQDNPYLEDNPYLQDNDSYPPLNLILNQIQTLKREWVWLKFCFPHAKGLWHYKYRPQWCKREGGEKIKKTLEGNKHKKPQEEVITRENQKKKTKNRGRKDWKEEEESILQSVPALLPSSSPLASPGKVFFFSIFLCNYCKKTMWR